MIHVFYAQFSDDLWPDLFNKYLDQFPKSIGEQNHRYQCLSDRVRHLAGKILLREALNVFGFDRNVLKNIKYTAFGRPYISDEIDFNISHAGQYAMCAIKLGGKLGVDIEKIETIRFSDFSNVMTSDQWNAINHASNPTKEFFKFWGMKESACKADGQGLSISPNEILIENNHAIIKDKKWFLSELHIDDRYISYLASEVEEKIAVYSFNLLELDYTFLPHSDTLTNALQQMS